MSDRNIRLGKFFYLTWWPGGMWFRFFNRWGMHFKNTRREPLWFSERNGYVKFLKVGKWRIRLLK